MNLIDRLKENPENPRTISKEKFEKLKNNIQNFPKMLELRPIVYNKDFIVLGGNMRLKAIKELLTEKKIKLKDSYFKKAESLTKDEQDKFIVLDNQEFGDWDFDSLANQFELQNLLSFGFTEFQLGINAKQINELNEWNENDMPEFNTDKEIKLIVYFKSKKQREKFCIDKEIEITKKQLDQWTCRL